MWLVPNRPARPQRAVLDVLAQAAKLQQRNASHMRHGRDVGQRSAAHSSQDR